MPGLLVVDFRAERVVEPGWQRLLTELDALG